MYESSKSEIKCLIGLIAFGIILCLLPLIFLIDPHRTLPESNIEFEVHETSTLTYISWEEPQRYVREYLVYFVDSEADNFELLGEVDSETFSYTTDKHIENENQYFVVSAEYTSSQTTRRLLVGLL